MIMCTTDSIRACGATRQMKSKCPEVYNHEGVKLDYWVIDAGWYFATVRVGRRSAHGNPTRIVTPKYERSV